MLAGHPGHQAVGVAVEVQRDVAGAGGVRPADRDVAVGELLQNVQVPAGQSGRDVDDVLEGVLATVGTQPPVAVHQPVGQIGHVPGAADLERVGDRLQRCGGRGRRPRRCRSSAAFWDGGNGSASYVNTCRSMSQTAWYLAGGASVARRARTARFRTCMRWMEGAGAVDDVDGLLSASRGKWCPAAWWRGDVVVSRVALCESGRVRRRAVRR